MKLTTLNDLFVEELKDLHSAENQILKALPRMVKTASAPELKQVFQEHLDTSQEQTQRLEDIFKMLNINPKGKKCIAMEGLLRENKELLSDTADSSVRDAALIAAAQRVEHYEMAGYGCVRTYARLLGHNQAADLLQQTLSEEVEADQRLTDIAETTINKEALVCV